MGNWFHSSQEKLFHLGGVPGGGRLIRQGEAESGRRVEQFASTSEVMTRSRTTSPELSRIGLAARLGS
jgi:hypothetical protein